MRILHIIPTLQKGGAERLVLDICNGLLKSKKAEVLLVVMQDINEFPGLSKNIPVRFCNSKVVPSISGKPIIKLEGFNKIVADFKPDIIHSHLFEADITCHWQTFSDIIYVTHCHDNLKQYRKFNQECLLKKSRFTDFYERHLIIQRYRKCKNNFIAISRDTESFLKNTLPKDIHRIRLLHNAIDLSSFKRKQPFSGKIPDKNNIRLINVGSFVDKKNQVFLVDVVKILQLKGYNVTLDLLGDGENRTKVENKINENKLSGSIFCRGKVDNVEELLPNADIYVHSATYEPFGLVLIEAMAAGLPVVCLDGKGNRDIIEEGKNGFLVSEHNPVAFASKIIDLIEDNELYKNISEYAQKFTLKFNMDSYIDSLMNYYQGLVAEKRSAKSVLKIMQVIPTLNRGGAEKMVLEISKHLKTDHNIEVLVASIYPPNESEFLSGDIIRIACEPVIKTAIIRKSVIDIKKYYEIVADFSPDIIHSHLYESEILSRWRLFRGIKYITHCHKNFEQLNKFSFKTLFSKKLLANFYERKLIINRYRKCNNHFITVSKETLSFYRNVLPKGLQNLTLMNNAIDFSKFNRNVISRTIDTRHPVKLLTVGSLVENKNQMFLIEVAEILIKKGINIHLNIIGAGPLYDTIEKEIKDRGLEKVIILTGGVNNVEDYYQKSDIYLHSSLFESLSLVMLEANAAGLPVVCIDAKGNRDVLTEGYNGFMLGKPDAELFSEKISLLISSPELYQKMSENAVRFASGFDIKNYVTDLVKLYQSLLR